MTLRNGWRIVYIFLILFTINLKMEWALGEIKVQRDEREPHINFVDGKNRLYVDVVIPYHEMGDASKRLAAARAVYLLKQDLLEMWSKGTLPTSLEAWMKSTMELGEIHFDKIYEQMKKNSDQKIQEVLSEVLIEKEKNGEKLFTPGENWLPAGIVTEIGAKGRFSFLWAKGVSGTITEVLVPHCVHKIRKIPLLSIEKDQDLERLLKDTTLHIKERVQNVILAKMYGPSCTENLGHLVDKLKQQEGTDFPHHYYVAEKSSVVSTRKMMVWLDGPLGSKNSTTGGVSSLGLEGKFSFGVVYGPLQSPEDFSGGTLSLIKNFTLPATARESLKKFIQERVPQLTKLANINWGLQAKGGVLASTQGDFFPYFQIGLQGASYFNPKAEFNFGFVVNKQDFFNSLMGAWDFIYGSTLGYFKTLLFTREDQFTLEREIAKAGENNKQQ